MLRCERSDAKAYKVVQPDHLFSNDNVAG